MELLSNQVLDPYPSRIDGEINGFSWGLKVNNGMRERELLLCFGHAKVRKKGAGLVIYRWEGKGKVYIPLAPNGHFKSQIAVDEERKRYIYLLAPNGHCTQEVGRDKNATKGSGEPEPALKGSGESELAPRKIVRIRVKCRLSWLWIWGCMWLFELLVV